MRISAHRIYRQTLKAQQTLGSAKSHRDRARTNEMQIAILMIDSVGLAVYIYIYIEKISNEQLYSGDPSRVDCLHGSISGP